MSLLPDRWRFKDRILEDFKKAVLSVINGRLDRTNAPTLTTKLGTGTIGKMVKWTDTDEIGNATNTDAQVSATVTASHARSHSIIGTSDHTSTATSGQILKANANGLPVDATNTDTDVASAVSLKHTRSHSITGTSDHTSTATSGKMLKADANGLPVDGSNTDTEVSTAVGYLDQDVKTTSSPKFAKVKTPIIYPATDSTAGVQINKANGTTNILNIDTTNLRVGIGTVAPVTKFDVVIDSSSTRGIFYNYSTMGISEVDIISRTSGVLFLNNNVYVGYGVSGKFGIGLTVPTAVLHLKAGTATANTAPLKFTSGTSLTTAEAGAIEFTTDDYYATITTGAARKGIILNDGTNLTSGKIPVATTNGRLTDSAGISATIPIAPVAPATNAGSATFTNGILTAYTAPT
jgi:hypothetical protein